MKETIEFKKQRELGDIITDSFKFIRLEYKELGSLILKTSGPALLAVILCYVFYIQTTLGDLENIFVQNNFSTNMVLSVFLLFASIITFYTFIYATVFLYIKSYINNQGTANTDDVSRDLKSYFWSMLGLSLLVSVIVVVGFIFCILPGVYLAVCLSLAFPILIFERNDIGSAISNSFKLIKNEWWITFATLFVVYILYSIVTMIFQIPKIIYFFIQGLAMSNEVSSNPFEVVNWVSITLDVVAMVAGYILSTFLIIAVTFVYYHLNEKKNFTGTLENIEKLGSQEL